jgi:hypothetical protein
MRASEFITEWRESYLYHATSIPNAIQIWRQDALKGGTGPRYGRTKFKGVSTTRNYNYALGYMTGDNYDDRGGVIFWINQELVKQDLGRRRLKGYDWFVDNDPDDTSDEFQYRSDFHDTDRFETVITKGGLTPFRKYVAKIEIWLPKAFDKAPMPQGLDPTQQFQWTNQTGPYALDYKDPDKHRVNIRPNEEVMNRYLLDPLNKQAWSAMLADPRTDVKPNPGLPKKHQGKFITRRVQYDQNHPMYRGNN